MRVFGTPYVPVTDDVPELALVCGVELPVFWLDLDRLTDAQRDAVLHDLSERFEIPLEEARAELPNGVPIVAFDLAVYSPE